MKKIILFGLMALLMAACSSSDDGLEPSPVPPAPVPTPTDGTKTDSAKTDTAKTEPETVKFAAKYRLSHGDRCLGIPRCLSPRLLS